MALSKQSLAGQIQDLFESEPSSPVEAAQKWASAYLSYAAGALSSLGSLPTTAQAGEGTLVGAFTAALNSLSGASAGALMGQGVVAYWQAMAWLGPTAAGVTVVPGNFALPGALAAIFLDLSGQTAREKASRVADAFDAGARAVMVSDQPFAPVSPVVAPIQ